jgi:hypothetical protein
MCQPAIDIKAVVLEPDRNVHVLEQEAPVTHQAFTIALKVQCRRVTIDTRNGNYRRPLPTPVTGTPRFPRCSRLSRRVAAWRLGLDHRRIMTGRQNAWSTFATLELYPGSD